MTSYARWVEQRVAEGERVLRMLEGHTADVVGRLLRSLARHTQVLCVTHAPQVAALGHHHLRVRKDDAQDTLIDALARDSRVEELARMLAGADITEKSRDYARTLLDEAVE